MYVVLPDEFPNGKNIFIAFRHVDFVRKAYREATARPGYAKVGKVLLLLLLHCQHFFESVCLVSEEQGQ